MKKNEIKLGVILSYLNTGIGMVMSLVYTPVMLRLLGQGQYGVYQTASSVISYLSLLSLGFGGSYVRFFSRYSSKNDEEGLKRLNGLYLVFYLIIATISLIAGFIIAQYPTQVFGSKFTDEELLLSQKLLYLLVVGVAINFVNHVFSSYNTAKEKFIYMNIVNICSAIINPCITLPLLIMGYGAVGLTVMSVVLTLASCVANIIFACKNGFCISVNRVEWQLFREIFSFSVFVLFSVFVGQLNSTIDKFLLARYIGSESVAVYEIGGRFNKYLMTFSVTVSTVFIPRINNYVAENRSNFELTALMTRVGRIQFYIMALIFGGFVLVGQYFIGIYVGDGYEQSYYIAFYLMGASFIPYCQNVGLEIQKAKNKHVFRSVAYLIIAIFNIGISIPLIKIRGISGAALGSAVAIVAGSVISMNVYYKKGIGLDMNYYWRSLLRPIMSAVIAFVPCFVVTRFFAVDRISRFIIVGTSYVILFCASAWFVGANDYEKELAKSFLRKRDSKAR